MTTRTTRLATQDRVPGSPGPDSTVTVTATEAQSQFGRVFDSAVGNQVVVITRHNAPRAVLMSIDRYNALTRAGTAALDSLSRDFDAMLAGMQTAAARAAMEVAFDASPDALARAALKEATSKRRGG